MMEDEPADASDKQNFRHWLKFMTGFLISVQAFRGKRKMGLT